MNKRPLQIPSFPPSSDPLGMDSQAFVRQFSGHILLGRLGGERGAIAAYRRLFRDADPSGMLQIAPAFEVPRVQTVQRELCDDGELVKFTRSVPGVDGKFDTLATESVLIPMIGRKRVLTYTLCVSSQVGCAMGCTFCETAQMGLIRSLTPGEIVAQWWAAAHVIGQRPSNIVFMGMGEPMDNLDHVLTAVGVLKDHNAACIPVSKITISTVGRVDGITRLAERLHAPGWHRLNLAISLNAPNDAVRSQIMPVNRKWNMSELQRALLAFPMYGGGKLCVEYVLIPGVNDGMDHAQEVADFLRPINEHYQNHTDRASARVMLNLIPYNPRRDSPWPAPSEESVDRFLMWLTERRIYTKRRKTKGRDLMGACGQLGSQEIRGRKLVQVGLGLVGVDSDTLRR